MNFVTVSDKEKQKQKTSRQQDLKKTKEE